MFPRKIKDFFFGKPKDPMDKQSLQSLSLITFLAWVGLGADGISSSSYSPEAAFITLGQYKDLAIFLAIATAITVFIIAFAYIQVIELFPKGGGGYRAATKLLGPRAGLVSGSALIVDYILTISISIAGGIDAIFSFLPITIHYLKLPLAIAAVILLCFLNLRGSKETIKFLIPIFIGFMVTHVFFIIYGIISHHYGVATLFPGAVAQAQEMNSELGWFVAMSIFLKAFSMGGGGVYTGIEGVSNNVNTFAEPRVKTAKLTMFLLAISLTFMMSGMILLYLLWDINYVSGQTLNASAFYTLTANWTINGYPVDFIIVPIVLIFEAGLLFMAANSGFLAGPNVISNMAGDGWMPKSFGSLSSRLVVKNGIWFMAITAIFTLIITGGSVKTLVILYSINVFLTLSLSMLGLTIHWFVSRHKKTFWWRKIIISGIGLIVCASILMITTFQKFYDGGWITLLITSIFIAIGIIIKQSYRKLNKLLRNVEKELDEHLDVAPTLTKVDFNKSDQTAAIIVDHDYASGMICLLEIKKLFPNVFKNFVFVTVGEVDSNTFAEERKWRGMRQKTKEILNKYKNYCNANGKFATAYVGYATDTVEKLTQLSYRVVKEYPNTIFFGIKFILEDENIFTQMMYNHSSYIMQRRLNDREIKMVILPIKI